VSTHKHHIRNPIRVHGDTPYAHFTIVPNELARDTELSNHAYRAAIVIRTHADGFEISTVSLAKSQGWGRTRTRDALRELSEARWLAIQPYQTTDGKRAFEEYHLHAARKFSPQESIDLAQPVVLRPRLTQTNPPAPTEPATWPDWDQPLGLAQATKEDHLEDHQENKQENQAFERDCWGCGRFGEGCPTHARPRVLAGVNVDEPDWPDSGWPESTWATSGNCSAPGEIPPF
jgi:hypothetical protein